jgi:DNA polymerase V
MHMSPAVIGPPASQRALFGALDREKSGRLMEAMDACNRKLGRGVVFPAAAGIARQQKAMGHEIRNEVASVHDAA